MRRTITLAIEKIVEIGDFEFNSCKTARYAFPFAGELFKHKRTTFNSEKVKYFRKFVANVVLAHDVL